ncbi:MAG: TolC family protein [Prolixibacteraceae bacterium]|nr:TolC family protein [Prolixibacteraceae bacterium]
MKAVPLIFFILFVMSYKANSQISIEDCQEKARLNYPLIRQYGLIDENEKLAISNANKGYLPQVTVSAKATYQSDVTVIPSSLGQILSQMTGREVTFPELSKDQYQAVLEINQLIWDGGIISANKKISNVDAEVSGRKLEVDLYALKERISQLFFGILIIDSQLKQNDLFKEELEKNSEKVNALIRNGIASQAELDIIKVEQINSLQREIELKSTGKAFMNMLAAFTGMKIDESTIFVTPDLSDPDFGNLIIKRPELYLFESQNKLIDIQKSLLYASNYPKVGLFLQGGYGQPGLNMFSEGFHPYYIGGVRFSWNLNGFYNQKNNLGKLENSKRNLDIQKEIFLFNVKQKITQQEEEIKKLKSVVVNDYEIVKLRENIKNISSAKLENGTLTVTDLVREINAENQARLLKSIHEIQLVMSIYNLKNNINN